ncbi:30S ribosomal protein S5 [Patescibacteria group bacterium]|nr:30S ribosomal protein S5 [Patescibacteria group bacterium]
MARQGKNNKSSRTKADMEFEQRIIDLARVTRVMAGGKRLRFRACVVLGDKKGKVGWAVAKGADVAIAVNKAVNKAKKRIFKVRLVNNTIPHQIEKKFKAARILLKPAAEGTGIIAGGAVRAILELAGIPNIYGKILGRTNNKINNAIATFEALKDLKYPLSLQEKTNETAAVAVIDEKSSEEYQERDLDKEEELEKKQEKLLKKEGIEEDQVKAKIHNP